MQACTHSILSYTKSLVYSLEFHLGFPYSDNSIPIPEGVVATAQFNVGYHRRNKSANDKKFRNQDIGKSAKSIPQKSNKQIMLIWKIKIHYIT
jgi:hypothetical protein